MIFAFRELSDKETTIPIWVWASSVAQWVKNPPARVGDTGDSGFLPGSGRSPGGGHGNPLQYSCLENPMDTGAWRAVVYGVLVKTHHLMQSLSSWFRSWKEKSPCSPSPRWRTRAWPLAGPAGCSHAGSHWLIDGKWCLESVHSRCIVVRCTVGQTFQAERAASCALTFQNSGFLAASESSGRPGALPVFDPP